MRPVYARDGAVIPLGLAGENRATAVHFDISDICRDLDRYTVTLVAHRSGDRCPYMVDVEINGMDAVWIVRSEDVARPGYGKCELVCTSGDTVVKKKVWTTAVGEAIIGYHHCHGDRPYEDWVNRVLQTADLLQQSRAEEFEIVNGHLFVHKLDGTTHDLGPIQGGDVRSVNGKTGEVKLTAEDFTGDENVITEAEIDEIVDSEKRYLRKR